MAAGNPFPEIAAFRDAHPATRFVDVLLADLYGIARSKRMTIEDLETVYRGRFLLPGSMFANPHLLTAAVLAGMHLGILERIDPGKPFSGNAYRDTVATLPTTGPEAAIAFERSNFIREYFGADFQRLYAVTRRGELDAFERRVTALEYELYARTL